MHLEAGSSRCLSRHAWLAAAYARSRQPAVALHFYLKGAPAHEGATRRKG
jgi:hypothetical protein